MSGMLTAAQFGNYFYTEQTSSITITAYNVNASGAVVIPSTIVGKPVTTIGAWAFHDCTRITSVTIPSSVTTLLPNAFAQCSALATVAIPSTVTSLPSGIFANCGSLNNVTIPAGVTLIGPSAFYRCTSLTSITVPEGVTLIDFNAFNGCSALATVTFPASLASIGTDAFAETGLKSISVATGNPVFSSVSGVLFNKNQTVLIQFPPQKAGYYSIPSGVTRIGEGAFEYCQKLTSLVIPSSVTTIDRSAFYACTKLTSLSLPSGLVSIGDGAFAYCEALGSIKIPTGVSSIGTNWFFGCKNLTSVTIPQNVTSIGVNAFGECAALSSIVIPASVTSIGDYAFNRCYKLASISLPASVTSIGSRAFSWCGVSSFTIPSSVTSIGIAAFAWSETLTSISVDAGNPNYCSVDGILFNKAKTLLLQCPSGKTGSQIIPHGTIVIEESAFEDCRGVTQVVIPSTITEIRSDAFWYCSSLTSVRIPSGVTLVGNGAFSSCDGLNQAVFLGNAPSVSSSPFSSVAAGFSVAFYNNRTGFSSPTWQGYPSVNLGDWVDAPQDLKVEDSAAGELVNGGAVPGIGSASIGGSSVVTLTLTNTGTVDLTNVAISKSGTDAADFQVSVLGSDYLIGGESLTFQITFAPTAIGIRSATLQIASSDADENPFELTLSGTGTAPEISIEQPAGTSIQDGGNRDFGTQVLGIGKPLVFTINNTGTGDLTGLATSITGIHASDFTVSSAPTSPVATGGSTTFTVAFKPSGTGNRGAVLHIANNDPDESPYDINLTGKGVALPEIAIEQPAGSGLVDGATKKSFGTVTVGKVGKTRKFIIKNTGTAKLTGLGLTRTGKHKKDFVISTLSKTSLLPGESTSFQAAFKPAAKGTRTAAIHVLSNDADESPFDITVTGAGAVK